MSEFRAPFGTVDELDQLIERARSHPHYKDNHSGLIHEITTLGIYKSASECFIFPYSRNVPYMSVNPLMTTCSDCTGYWFVLSTCSIMVLDSTAMKQLNETGTYQDESRTITIIDLKSSARVI